MNQIRRGRPAMPLGAKIGEVLTAVKIVTLEQRLSKGWDYLDERPAEDRPGQRSYDHWMALLTEYQDMCRDFHTRYGRRWTFETRELAVLGDDDEQAVGTDAG